MTANTRPNPYVGPYPFEEGQELYGRDQERRDLLDLLIAERVVVLYSPSGAGKTSLIQAALVPDLVAESFDVLPPMRVSMEPPAEAAGAAGANRYVLSALLSLEKKLAPEWQTPAAELAGLTFAGYLDRRPVPENGHDNLVLIFDQFEEVLTVDPTDQAAKREFFAQVGEALRNPHRWALFAMREEFLAGLDPYVRPIPTRLSTRYRLELLGKEAAREAIQKPARGAGVLFAGDAAQQLVDDLRRVRVQRPDGTTEEILGPTVEPVQLQVVCARLWEGLTSDDLEIGLDDLTKVGNVNTALQGYYAERVAAVAAEKGVPERQIRDWFDGQLITEQGIRSQVMQGPEESGGLANAVIWRLVDVRLVRAERRRGVNWFELAHDRLIAPVQADNTAWRATNLSDFQRQAALWDKQDRPAGLLLSGETLRAAEAWSRAHAEELTDAERALLLQSQAARASSLRTRRWAIAATAASVLAVVAMLAALALAVHTRDEQQRAVSRQLAAQSENLVSSQYDLALLLSLAAEARADTTEAKSSLLTALDGNRIIAAMLPAGDAPLPVLATTRDGNTVAAGSADGAVTVWDFAGKRPQWLATLPRQAAGITGLAFNPLRAELAVGDSKGTVVLWDYAASPPVSRTFPANTVRVNGLAYTGDGSQLATIGKKELILWNLADAAWPPSAMTLEQGEPTRSLAASPDGKTLAVGRDSGEVALHNLATGEVRSLDGEPGAVQNLAWSSDGQRLAASHQGKGQDPQAVEVWDLRAGASQVLFSEAGATNALTWAPDSRLVAISGPLGPVELWDTLNQTRVGVLADGYRAPARSAAFISEDCTTSLGAPGGPCTNRLLTASDDGKIVVWTPERTNLPRLYEQIGGHVDSALAPVEAWAVAVSPNGKFVASGGQDKIVRLWSLETGQAHALPGHAGEVRAVAWSPDGQRLASGGQDGLIVLWQAGDQPKELARWSHPSSQPIASLAWSPDGESLASGSFDNTVMLWNLDELPPKGRVIGRHDNKVWQVGFEKDGDTLLASDDAGDIRRWDTRTGRQVGAPHHVSDAIVPSFALSPDGKLMADASYDNNAYLLDSATGKRLATLSQHQAPVSSVRFIDDGKTLASASHDGTVVFWDVAAHRQIGDPIPVASGKPVNALAVSSDGARMASVDDSGAVLLWRPDWPQMACEIAGRGFTGDEIVQYGIMHAERICGK